MGTAGRSAACLLVVVGLLITACATSSPPVAATYSPGHFPAVPTGSFSASTVSAMRAVLDSAIKGGLPGVTATVLSADGRAWSGAAGTADGNHPVEVRSQFGIGSITKTVIATEVMRLSDQGLLRLSDPLADDLPPNFHFDTNGATIENLLHMESGIPDPALSFTSAVDADPLRDWTAQEVLATVPADRSKPGGHFDYVDSNYMLLGLVIEKMTGTSVAAALRSYILADPYLSSMVYQPDERPNGPLALPFLQGRVRSNILETGGGYLPTKATASFANGSGGMASDSAALALWGYLLFGGKLVSNQSLLAMTKFGPDLGDGSRYGLGVYDETKLGSGFADQVVGNGGRVNDGYSTILSVLPSEGIVISVLTNTDGDPVDLVLPVAQALASSLRR